MMKFSRYSPPTPVDESKLSNGAYPAPPSGVKRTHKDYGIGESANRLPIAPESTVNKEMKILFLKHKLGFLSVAFLTLLTVAASLVPPRVFGNFLQTLQKNPEDVQISQVVGIVGIAILVRTIFSYLTNVRASILGEFILSSVRERFVEKVIEIPPSAAERAGSGELLSRTTTDIDQLQFLLHKIRPSLVIFELDTLIKKYEEFLDIRKTGETIVENDPAFLEALSRTDEKLKLVKEFLGSLP